MNIVRGIKFAVALIIVAVAAIAMPTDISPIGVDVARMSLAWLVVFFLPGIELGRA